MARLTDIERYADEWARVQLDIWREKIERMKVVRTGALHQSLRSRVTHGASSGGVTTIEMKFAQYGLYQAAGTGRGYTRGNPGDLEFLDKDYRAAHGLDKPRKVGPAWGGYKTSGKPRKARDWYSRKLYMSWRALVEDAARILGENAAATISGALGG